MQEIYSQNQANTRSVDVTKVLRNTYALLAMTLLTSAVAAGITMRLNLGHGAGLIFSLAGIGLLWFVLPRTANSSKGVITVFAFTACLGAGLGPMLNHYMALQNGGTIIMQALGTTALIFFGLSGYVLSSGKDFSFMRGFLLAGLIMVIVSFVAMFVAGLFGVQITGFMLAINAVVVLLMSGFILYDTSRIIHGGETNYLMATASMYLNILNLFTSLLHLIGAFSGDD